MGINVPTSFRTKNRGRMLDIEMQYLESNLRKAV